MIIPKDAVETQVAGTLHLGSMRFRAHALNPEHLSAGSGAGRHRTQGIRPKSGELHRKLW